MEVLGLEVQQVLRRSLFVLLHHHLRSTALGHKKCEVRFRGQALGLDIKQGLQGSGSSWCLGAVSSPSCTTTCAVHSVWCSSKGWGLEWTKRSIGFGVQGMPRHCLITHMLEYGCRL